MYALVEQQVQTFLKKASRRLSILTCTINSSCFNFQLQRSVSSGGVLCCILLPRSMHEVRADSMIIAHVSGHVSSASLAMYFP